MKLVRKEYTTQEEKKKDFWIGVGIWVGLNLLLGLINIVFFNFIYIIPNLPDGLYTILGWAVMIFPYVLNIGLLIYFALTRSQIALGMLAAFGAVLLIVICLGLIFMVACFVLISTQGFGG
jgi:hypothetical protein